MEPHITRENRKSGWIEVICGSMFSGKTEELIRRLRRAQIARQRVEIFKPAMEDRFSADSVVSHDESTIHSTPVHSAAQIMLLVGNADVVGIDEGQFFDAKLVDLCTQLARSGRRVIVAGLDQDYRGQPFEPMPQLMAVSEHVTKLHAVCVVCGAPANHSQRIAVGSDRVLLGAADAYEPRCRDCFRPQSIAEPPNAEESARTAEDRPLSPGGHPTDRERGPDGEFAAPEGAASSASESV